MTGNGKPLSMSIFGHGGRELDLMKKGAKPVCMFNEDAGERCSSKNEFDECVSSGLFVKRTRQRVADASAGTSSPAARVFYALPGEEWRIDALDLVLDVYVEFGGWRPDLERVIGRLLGHSAEDIERHFRDLLQR